MNTNEAPSSSLLWVAIVSVVAYATIPFAGFVAENVREPLSGSRLLAYWLASVGVASVITAIAGIWRGRLAAAQTAATTSLSYVLIFNFHALHDVLSELNVRESLHIGVWLFASVTLVILVWRVSTSALFRQYVAAVGIGLLVLPILQVAGSRLSDQEAPRAASGRGPQPAGSITVRRPNVYYFVVDGYGRQDVLDEIIRPPVRDGFHGFLHERGFHISDRGSSNYTLTFLSVASTLDMTYLLTDGDEFASRDPFYRRLGGDNRLVRTLRSSGYSYVHASSSWEGSGCTGAEDVCVAAEAPRIGEMEWALLRMTPLAEILPRFAPELLVPQPSDPVSVTREVLARSTDATTPFVLFAHVLSPHPPYVFRDDCTLRSAVSPDLQLWGDDAVPLYRDALVCLNSQLRQAVELILEEDGDPVVVIQADHGPAFTVDWDAPLEGWSPTAKRERFSIFSAVRLPRYCSDVAIPEDLVAVNTFRIVLSCMSDEPFPALPDRRFVSNYSEGRVVEVEPVRPSRSMSASGGSR